jgi:hypothetical protein
MKRRCAAVLCLILILLLASMLLSACVVKLEIAGDYQRPDRLGMTVKIHMGEEIPTVIEIICVGDDIYAQGPGIGLWTTSEELERDGSAIYVRWFERFADSITQVVNSFRVTEMLASEEIDEVLYYHFKGTVDPAVLENPEMNTPAGFSEPLEAEIWIGKDDFLVRRLTATGKLDFGDIDEEMSMALAVLSLTYEFSHFNEPITIEAPETSS